MNKRVIQILRTLVMLSAAVWLCGCTPDRELFEARGGEGEKSLTFSVRIPVPAVPHTYAMNGGNEDQVKEIDMLLFTSTSSGSSTYKGVHVAGRNLALSGASSNVMTFTVKVPEGTYDLVVLANCRAILNDPSVSFAKGDTKASVLGKLKVDMGATNGWNATPGSAGYIAIPMWGEMPNQVVNATTPASLSMSLTRMLAKIDVSVDASLQSQFKLKSVRLYNRYTEGSVAPLAINWNDGLKKVTAPSPLGAKTQAALTYTVDTPFKAYLGEIYTFEAPAGTVFSTTANTNTCLVIGGEYGTDGSETFYRIDFVDTSVTTPRYLSLLRNHSYKVNIKQISGSGYANAGDAFGAHPVHIKAGVTVWDDSKITQVAYDDQYMLGVSDDELTFTREVRTATHTDNTLWVTTDVPVGWKVDKIVDGSGNDINPSTNPTSGWLSLSPNTDNSGGTVDTKVLLSQNTAGGPRTGFIHLRAGRLTQVVTVHQTAASALSLAIRDAASNTVNVTDLFFGAGVGDVPAAQLIRLSWMSVDQSVSVSAAAVGDAAFTYSTASDKPGIAPETSYTDASSLGMKTLSIQPAAITAAELTTNPFLEKASNVEFKVAIGPETLSKNIIFRQQVYNLAVNQSTSYYPLNGSQYTLHVRSNANWRIKSVTPIVTSGSGILLNLQGTDNLVVGTTGGMDTGTGTPVSFTVVNGLATLSGTLTIVFESTDSSRPFGDVTVALFLSDEHYPTSHNGWAGSNIYWDGSKMTFDDVDVQANNNYQGLYFQWGSLWGISPLGTWANNGTTVYSPAGSTGTMATYTSIPRVTDASIYSNPPTALGKTDNDRAYLYEITNGSTGIGDICKYLTEKGWAPGSPAKKWRMPTSSEFGVAADYTVSGVWGFGTSTDATGKFKNSNAPGWTKKGTIGTPFFPASGLRNTSGALQNVSNLGYYWSGTPSGTTSLYLNFSKSGMSPGSIMSRLYGFPVRCVVE